MKKKALKKLAIFTAAMTIVLSSMTAFAEGTYTTKAGDNLSKIAKEIYGDALKWREIYESNKSQIKDPNVIYSNQTLVIPDLGGQTVETPIPEVVETPVETETPAEADAPAETEVPATDTVTPEATETVSTPVKNAPVGTNPVWSDYAGGGYIYTFFDGSWVQCVGKNYTETVDAYGVTYRDAYGNGAGAIVASKLAEYVATNPNSSFASMITQSGDQFVFVITEAGLWDDTYDYDWVANVVDCEPYDCMYMFIAGNVCDSGELNQVCNEIFTSINEL